MYKPKLPHGWGQTALENLASVQTGIAKGKSVNGTTVSVPYLRVANVQDGHVDLSVMKEITLKPTEVDRYSLKKGDVLFTEGGDFDKLGRGTVWNAEIELCLHQNHVFAVRPDSDHLLPEFLAYLAASQHGRRYFQLSSKQSTNLASINSTQLKQFPVLLPPLSEQRKIVAVLQTWDKALEKLTALRAAKERRFVAIAQRLLAPSRAIGRHIPPSNWKLTSFGEVFEERKDRNTDLEADDAVTVGKYAIRKQSEHFSRSVASKDLSNYWIISPGDFVYDPMSAYYGALGRYTGRGDGIVSPAYRVIRLKSGINPDFMVHILRSHAIRFLLETRSSQGNKEGKRRLLSRDEFGSVEFKLPDIEVQQAIAGKLWLTEQDLALTTAEIEALARQKRGLMQKLLTGEWPVTLDEED